jgi:hypothetical protein
MIVELIGGPYDGVRIDTQQHTTLKIPYLDIHPKLLQHLIHRYQTGEDIEPEIAPHIIELTYQPNNQNDIDNGKWRLQP